MPVSFQFDLAYRISDVRFVEKQMQVWITTFVALTHEHVSDICSTCLAKPLEKQRYITHYAVMDLPELLFVVQQLKIVASGRTVVTGEVEILKATLRPDRESTEPRSRTPADFILRTIDPKDLAFAKALFAFAARRDHFHA